MPSRSKANISRHSRDAVRHRLRRARETDEERSERLAATREYQKRRYNKKKVMTQPPISQVRIVNVRTLRPGADKRCSEKDWLKAVKSRMYSEKAWLADMKERSKSERVSLQFKKGWLGCEDVHCKPLFNSEMEPLNYEKNPCISEKDQSNSEEDLSSSVEGGLNTVWLRDKTWTAQDLESIEINVEVLNIKEEVLDTIKEEVLDD